MRPKTELLQATRGLLKKRKTIQRLNNYVHDLETKILTSRDRARPWRRPEWSRCRRCCRTTYGKDGPCGSHSLVLFH